MFVCAQVSMLMYIDIENSWSLVLVMNIANHNFSFKVYTVHGCTMYFNCDHVHSYKTMKY